MEWEMARNMVRIGFVFVDDDTKHLALRLIALKEEGANLPDGDDDALKAFTAKWHAFCDAPENTQWKLVDERGYREGLWA